MKERIKSNYLQLILCLESVYLKIIVSKQKINNNLPNSCKIHLFFTAKAISIIYESCLPISYLHQ